MPIGWLIDKLKRKKRYTTVRYRADLAVPVGAWLMRWHSPVGVVTGCDRRDGRYNIEIKIEDSMVDRFTGNQGWFWFKK